MRSKIYLILYLLFFSAYTFASTETFTIEPLPKTLQTLWIKDGVWHPRCPVPLHRLKLLTVTYYDFDGKAQLGKLVIFDAIAPLTLDAFKKMYAMHYPLEPVGFKGEANEYQETSAYNCRPIRGESGFSMHAYGLAIDINVTRNPYIGEFKVENMGDTVTGQLIPPIAFSYPYLNRSILRPGMNEQIVTLMAQSGFIRWGGEWQDRVDYQHFEVPENITKNLIYLDEKSGEQFLQLVIKYPDSAKKMSMDSKWKYLYQLYPKRYITVLAQYFPLLRSMNEKDVFALIFQKLSSTF